MHSRTPSAPPHNTQRLTTQPMLVEFRFANFRSYRDEQVFSMGAYMRAPDGLEFSACDTGRKDLPPLLKTAFLLGPNASGKTNMLAAFEAMQRVVRTSALMTSAPEKAPAYEGHDPFLYDEGIQKEPTYFEVTLELEGMRWQYGFLCGKERIEEEYLVAYNGVSPRVYFERVYIPEEEAYAVKYGPYFKGRRKAWEEATRADALFLPTAVMLRFIPTFTNDIRQIWETLRIRGWAMGPEMLTLHPLLSARLLLVPILFRALKSSETLGIASELKGLGTGERTVMPQGRTLTSLDARVVAAAVTTTILVVLAEVFFRNVLMLGTEVSMP